MTESTNQFVVNFLPEEKGLAPLTFGNLNHVNVVHETETHMIQGFAHKVTTGGMLIKIKAHTNLNTYEKINDYLNVNGRLTVDDIAVYGCFYEVNNTYVDSNAFQFDIEVTFRVMYDSKKDYFPIDYSNIHEYCVNDSSSFKPKTKKKEFPKKEFKRKITFK